jgi:ABC-type branched-subunit amino acid transport system ATPase component
MRMPSDDETVRRPAPYLRAQGIAAGYGGPPIVRDVSVQCGLGEIVALLGTNGAGKSTLLKALVGQLRVDQGRVWIGDREITSMSAEARARSGLGYVPQSQDVFDTLTVSENLEIGGYLLPRRRVAAEMERVISVFPALGRMRHRVAGKLSGGERKMLAMARVMMLEPRLLLLDEPTAGLTEGLAEALLQEHIVAAAVAGCAVLLVEQRAIAALRVAAWGYVLVSGTVTVSESASGLLARGNIGEALLGWASAPSTRSPPHP